MLREVEPTKAAASSKPKSPAPGLFAACSSDAILLACRPSRQLVDDDDTQSHKPSKTLFWCRRHAEHEAAAALSAPSLLTFRPAPGLSAPGSSDAILLAHRPSRNLVDDDDMMTHNRVSFPNHCSAEAATAAPSPPLHSLLSVPRPGSPPRAFPTSFSLPAVHLKTWLIDT